MDTLVDTHCHLDFIGGAAEQHALWQRCRAAGLSALLVPGVSPSQWSRVVAAATDDGIFVALGVHPCYLGGADVPVSASAAVQQLQQQIEALPTDVRATRLVAIGECGLDGMIDTPMSTQIHFFEAQLELARHCALPVVIHARRCHNDMLRCLKRVRVPRGGVIHAFSGSTEIAREYVALGFLLGVGGTITYERANKTRNTLAHMPLASLLLETDAPDMPLAGRQGEPNSPLHLPLVAAALAQLRGESPQLIARQTTANAQRLFGFAASAGTA